MDKLDGLRAGVAEMRSVAQRLNKWADDLERSFQGQEAPELEVPAAKSVQPEPRKKQTERKAAGGDVPAVSGKKPTEKKPLTLPEVRAVLAEKCAAGFSAQVKALIESYGASSLKEVPADRYEELLASAAGLGGDAIA